jgi:hypothetical protein
LKSAKRTLLRAGFASGLARKVRDSAWRSSRILILAYHGVSISDEHEWNPELYLPAHALRGRLKILKDEGYNVLPLRKRLNGWLPALSHRERSRSRSTMALDFHRARCRS